MQRAMTYLVFVGVLSLAPVVSADLVGWWTFDDGSGTVAADASGNKNSATFQGDPEWVAGKYGGALNLDGDDSLTLGDPPALQFGGAITIMGWINPSSVSGQRALAGRDGAYVFKGSDAYLRFTTPGIRDHTAAVASLRAGTWQHVAVTFKPSATGGVVFYYNAVEVSRVDSSSIAAGTGPFRIGNDQWSEFFVGLIDDVRVYNSILTPGEIQAAMENLPDTYPAAPRPTDGSMAESVQITLEWRPGALATSHDVYFGEDKDAVANATTADASVFLGSTTNKSFRVGFAGTPYPQGLTPGQTYYWRVDAVNPANPESPWKSVVWSFRVRPAEAWAPSPADQGRYVDPNDDLGWQKGLNALYYTVIIGESLDQVSNAAVGAGTPAIDPMFDPGPLKLGTTYYWRIDEFLTTYSWVGGNVWSFTTLPVIPVTDPNLLARWTLDEASGTKVVDWSGHGHHGTVVGAQWVDGHDGAALAFNGVSDYVDLGTPQDLYLPRDYTYCAWFRVAQNIHGNSGSQYLLCIGSRSDLVFGVEDLVGVDGDLSLHYYDTAPGFHAVGAGQTDWLAGGWHMAAGTKDAAGGHKLYIDGVLENSDTNTNNDNYATTRMISLGAMAWINARYFHGVIDEVRIYNKALTEQEIQQVMAGDPLRASEPAPALDSTVDLRDASELAWTAGSGAVSHDVYFSTDRASVAGTGRDSPAYMGNQAAASFSLADLVDLSVADYYWRIDEVQADGTAVAGQLWKFTVPPYLIVDDFESYTDTSPYRVFQTWIDGWGFSPDAFFPNGGASNGTTATVGYDPTVRRIMETTIAVNGQSAPMDYNNINQPYYAEAERTWPTPQDWTAGGVTNLSLQVRGYPIGFAETSPGNITMSASGADIYNLTDEFRYAYKRLSGDGSLTVRVESLVDTAAWAKAGVMIRVGLQPVSAQVHMIATPSDLVEFMYRRGVGLATTQIATAAGSTPLPYWVRLIRTGNTFTGEYSADGTSWNKITAADGTTSTMDIPMSGDVYIGLAVTATNASAVTTAVFSNVQVVGATGPWQVAEIGVDHPGNDPATLYVTLTDSANRSATVPYDDTSAVLTTEFAEWSIPLSRFTNVNPKAIKKMVIGVGDRKNPQADGAGRLFIDDIRVVKP
jgi:hypothetical protein